MSETNIVSKGGAETLCPQTFIVKVRIPILGRTLTFYSGTERRGNRLVARETERQREKVSVQLCVA